MSGGSDFEMVKLELHDRLNELKTLTKSQDVINQIAMIQRQLAALQEY